MSRPASVHDALAGAITCTVRSRMCGCTRCAPSKAPCACAPPAWTRCPARMPSDIREAREAAHRDPRESLLIAAGREAAAPNGSPHIQLSTMISGCGGGCGGDRFRCDAQRGICVAPAPSARSPRTRSVYVGNGIGAAVVALLSGYVLFVILGTPSGHIQTTVRPVGLCRATCGSSPLSLVWYGSVLPCTGRSSVEPCSRTIPVIGPILASCFPHRR